MPTPEHDEPASLTVSDLLRPVVTARRTILAATAIAVAVTLTIGGAYFLWQPVRWIATQRQELMQSAADAAGTAVRAARAEDAMRWAPDELGVAERASREALTRQRVEQEGAWLVPNAGPGRNLIEIQLENGASLTAKTVILATGARWRNINVPGEHEYKNKGVAYCPHCDGPLFKGKRVAVIGGGNSGVEAAIDLAGIVGHVTLVEFDTALRADAVLQRKLRSLTNVTVFTHAQTTEITGDSQKVNGLVYKDRTSNELHTVELEGVFIQIGLVPNTDWLKGTVELSKHGEIVVDARGQTSVPGVFAAGDATTVPFKQIVIAAGDGAKAALSAFDHLIRTTAPAA